MKSISYYVGKNGDCEWLYEEQKPPNKNKVFTQVTEDTNWAYCADMCYLKDEETKYLYVRLWKRVA